jgi:hypothetical protein
MNTTFDRQVLCIARQVATAVAALCAMTSSYAATGIRPVYVEPVLPSKPFHTILISESFAAGPSVGVLGITSLTIYNAASVDTFVSLYSTEVVGPTCSSAPVQTANNRLLTFFRIPKATQIHVTYPSPLVVEPIAAANGLTCIRFIGGSNMSVNGFVN